MTPFLMLIFRRGDVGTSVVVGIVVFFPTLVNVIIGMRTAPEQAIDMVSSFGGSTTRAIRKVRFPYALPALFASARIAVPAAIGGATLAEWLATGRGLGNLIVVSYATSAFNTLWASTVVIVAVAVIVYVLVRHARSDRTQPVRACSRVRLIGPKTPGSSESCAQFCVLLLSPFRSPTGASSRSVINLSGKHFTLSLSIL